MTRKLLSLILFLFSFQAAGQYVIRGKAIGSDDKLPLPQVIVMVTGTTHGTPTNRNGEFSLEVTSRDITLTISYLGYVSQIITPDFTDLNLVKLKPDCIRDHFRSPHLKLFGSFDVNNTQPGGRLEMRLPYSINANIFTSHSFYSYGNNEDVYRGEFLYNDIIHGCDLEFNLKYSLQSYTLNSQNLNFKSSLISSEWEINQTAWIIGMGIGQDRLTETQSNFVGFQAGFDKEFRISKKFYLPITATFTRWKGFSDYRIATSRLLGPVQTRLEFNHIKGFSQINLSLGFRIRLYKLNEYQVEICNKRRQFRRDKGKANQS